MVDEQKLVVGIDLDAVCADHNEAFASYVSRILNVDPSELPPQTEWNYHSWGLSDEDFLRVHPEAVRSGLYLGMEPLPGVALAIRELIDKGFHIRIISHRLYVSGNHEEAISQTVEWLEDHGIWYDDLCMIGDKPDVDADVYIDDAPHNVLALQSRTNKPVIIFDQPYNRHVSGYRVYSWAAVVEMVERLTHSSKRILGRMETVLYEPTLEEIELVDSAENAIEAGYHDGRTSCGAAVRGVSGRIYTALDCLSPDSRSCAEPGALAAAWAGGEVGIEAVAVCSHNGSSQDTVVAAPCGYCRELINHHAPDARVLLSYDGSLVSVRVAELSPFSI